MIEQIYLSDNDENYAPPEKPILEVGLVCDVAFLTIGKYEETHETRTFTEDAGMGVCVSDLVNALKVLAISQERHDLVRLLGTDRDLRPANI